MGLKDCENGSRGEREVAAPAAEFERGAAFVDFLQRMNSGLGSVQLQLRDDWNNREYEQIISENIKNISIFLSNFELSCRSKLATLADKLNLLERKVEFLEAKVTKGDTLS